MEREGTKGGNMLPGNILDVINHFKRTGAFKTGEFILASGKKSNVYVDCRLATLDGPAIMDISNVLAFLIKEKLGDLPEFIGGVTSGADPIVTGVIMAAEYIWREGMQGFFVRKETKDHGTKRQIEGYCPPGAKVVIVDDVATTGGSSQIAIDAVKAAGAEVLGVFVIVDREEGAKQRFEDQGIPLYSLLTLKELVSHLA
jgi:orotate phosphoribosyltransferase